jgi:TonB family protein
VTAPVLLTQVLPEYSEEARKARFQGTVVLDTIVREDGSVQVMRVARSIGFGLDQKAIEAVLKWKFQPGRKNGNPVPVALNVQVNFNLR